MATSKVVKIEILRVAKNGRWFKTARSCKIPNFPDKDRLKKVEQQALEYLAGQDDLALEAWHGN